MNEKKLRIIIEIVIVLVSLIYLSIKYSYPEIKQKLSGSDALINTKKYKNMIELNIDDKVDFILVLDKEKIYHIFFINNSSCLYDKKIENNELDKSIDIVVSTLIENNLLNNKSNIIITRYNKYKYNDIKKVLDKTLTKYKINTNLIEKKSSINKLKNKYKLSSTTDKNILLEFDLQCKNKLIQNNETNTINTTTDSKLLSPRKYSNNIYKSIEKYLYQNNITDIEKDNQTLLITTIPGDEKGTIYSTNNSWYYAKDKNIYAYIELVIDNEIYKYCYEGSIDNIKEGEC